MPISPSDLSETIGAIYDCALDTSRWCDALRAMSRPLAADAGGIVVANQAERSTLIQQRWGGDPHWLKLFDDKYTAVMPFYSVLHRQEVGSVFNNEELIEKLGDRSVLDGPFFKEWVEPSGYCDTIGAIVLRSGDRFGILSFLLTATRGASTAHDLDIARLYTPHVRRAIEISDLLGLRTVEVRTLDETLDRLSIGVLVVGDDQRVLYANAAGARIMDRADVLTRANGVLRAVAAASDAALADAVARIAADPTGSGQMGAGVPLIGRSGQKRIAHVLPLQGPRGARVPVEHGVAAVFASLPAEAGPTLHAAVAGLFGLTPGEERVLAAMLRGGARDDIATALGISRETLKTHLARIYAKTGTSGHAELHKLVAGLSLPLAQND